VFTVEQGAQVAQGILAGMDMVDEKAWLEAADGACYIAKRNGYSPTTVGFVTRAVIFKSRLHWEGATRAVLKSSSENHVSEEHFSNWQGRAMTRWQSDRVIVSYRPRACENTLQ
jgi:hypothetical protein